MGTRISGQKGWLKIEEGERLWMLAGAAQFEEVTSEAVRF